MSEIVLEAIRNGSTSCGSVLVAKESITCLQGHSDMEFEIKLNDGTIILECWKNGNVTRTVVTPR